MARPKKTAVTTEVTVAAIPADKPIVQAQDDGKFKPGQSGNPAGRPISVRKAISDLQTATEQAIRGAIPATRVVKVVEKLLALAEKGNTRAAGIIMPYFISKPSTDSGESGGGGKIIIQVENATIKAIRENESPATVDGEFTEVKNG